MEYYFKKQQKSVNVQGDKQLVELMRTKDSEYSHDNEEFMKKYAIRKYKLNKIVLSTSDEESFVKSMIESGIVKKNYFEDMISRFMDLLKFKK